MSSTKAPSTLTIFGSTGGSGLALIRNALQSGNTEITVLLRTPSKLLDLLEIKAAPANLRIIRGSITDSDAVAKALTTSNGNNISDTISFSVGMAPPKVSLKALIKPFDGMDTEICHKGIRTVLDTLAAMRARGMQTASRSADGPLLVAWSTTGISDAGRDIPLHMIPLYHGLLGVAHKDKKNLEVAIANEKGLRWVIVRPSLLMGDGRGDLNEKKKIRVGLERNGRFEKKEIGSLISREAVGTWVWENLVVGDGKRYEAAMVSLTF